MLLKITLKQLELKYHNQNEANMCLQGVKKPKSSPQPDSFLVNESSSMKYLGVF